jgi:MFS transporter, DHA2 family, multidrug resistance protein
VALYFPLGFLFVPANTAAYIGVPADKSNAVPGLVNFMRTMGCSIGTSLVTTLVDRRSQFHQVHLVSRLAGDNPSFVAQYSETVRHLAAAGLGTWEAQSRAYAGFYQMVQAQAQALAYIDTFWWLAGGAALMVVLSFALERNDPKAGGTVALH